MRRWALLISLLLNALFAPQLSILCSCPPPPALAPDDACPCCAAGECDCSISPSNSSTLPAKAPLILTRVGEQPFANVEPHGLSSPPSFRAASFGLLLRATSLPSVANASQRRALLCQWQT